MSWHAAGSWSITARSVHTQAIPGAFGFIAQFNEGRGSKKRPTEICVDKVREPSSYLMQALHVCMAVACIACNWTLRLHADAFGARQVVQPFDAKKFNFTKALQKEVLFQFAAHSGADGAGADYEPLAPVGSSPNLVFINVSPIEYGHVLLVPRALSDLPQARCSSATLQGLCWLLTVVALTDVLQVHSGAGCCSCM